MGVGRVPLLVGSTLRLAILGPLGIRVEVVLHVFQGFVLFPVVLSQACPGARLGPSWACLGASHACLRVSWSRLGCRGLI